ncbi:Uncharacterized protein FWK35_00031509, partial [Aphis craccivora]
MNWHALQKGKSCRSQPQIKKEEVFKDRLTDLFDIAHLNALQIIKIDEDKKFLLAQREKGRKGCLIGIDRKLEKQEMRKNLREITFQNYKNRSKKTQELSVPDTNDLFSSESCSEEDIEFTLETTNNSNKRKRGRQNIMNSEIVTALDRTKVISFKPDCPLTVHWDGKILPDITGKDNVDRLPILVSGDGVSKLLSVPKLESGTGEAISNAVIDPSTGPNIQIFLTFQQQWKNIEKNKFQVLEERISNRDEVIIFCKEQLISFHSRDDYRELLELIIIYLGGVPTR